MEEMKLGVVESRFADIIWNNAPLGSGELVKLAEAELGWKPSTTYTILKRLELSGMLTVHTSEHGGRLRKYYHITKAGLGRIEDFKDEWREVMSIYRFVTKEDEVK